MRVECTIRKKICLHDYLQQIYALRAGVWVGVLRLSACLSKGHTRCSRARALVELLLAAVTFTAAVALLFGIEKDRSNQRRCVHQAHIWRQEGGRRETHTQHSSGLVASDLLNLCLACLHPSRWVVLCVKSITDNNNGNNKTSILSSALAQPRRNF